MVKKVSSHMQKLKKKEIESWRELHCLENNHSFVEKLMKTFKIHSGNFVQGVDGEELIFRYKLDQYKVQMNNGEMCLTLLKNNNALNPRKKEYYHIVRRFVGSTPWYDLFKFVANKRR